MELHVYNLSQIDSLPESASASDIKRETRHDPTMSKVLDLTLNGWTYKPQDERLKPFCMRRNELSVQNGCFMWGICVIIPIKLRNKVLDELLLGHIGIVKMKELSRSFFCRPKLDNDIEQLARKCAGCQVNQTFAASLGMAFRTLGTYSYRLRWTFYGKHVSYRGRCTFKMTRSTCNELHYCLQNNRCVKANICPVWRCKANYQ